ncbi:hypothetical protein HPB50_018648 [Hyalomma asiaticum]|uniref:Uncharacterized protein n=1 Tax=Hyalomma asiaticum TaxID=266040 RepID=A0ACB7SXA2_HYAAI|nr:hypothetical protein HPB50_018648 [Hyalomma asiaticum]
MNPGVPYPALSTMDAGLSTSAPSYAALAAHGHPQLLLRSHNEDVCQGAAVEPPADSRQEHSHMMFLSPVVPNTPPANDPMKITKTNLDLAKKNIAKGTLRKTRNGIIVLTKNQDKFITFMNALQKNVVTSTAISIKVPEKRELCLKTTGVNPDIPGPSIINEINNRNSTAALDPNHCRVIITCKELSGNLTYWKLILSQDAGC